MKQPKNWDFSRIVECVSAVSVLCAEDWKPAEALYAQSTVGDPEPVRDAVFMAINGILELW